MQEWIGPNGEFPYTLAAMRKAFPSVSFPKHPSAESLAEYGIYPARDGAQPEYNPDTQALDIGEFVVVDGVYERQWVARDKTAAELAEGLQAIRYSMRVPRLAARLALIEAGLWSNIEPIIESIPDATQREITRAFFEDAQNWERLDPVVIQLGQALGLDEDALDNLFKSAAEKF